MGFETFLQRLSLEVIASYDFSVPLHRYIGDYFRANKKLGSRDRRGIRSLVYSYYRLGRALSSIEPAERLQAAVFLLMPSDNPLFQEILNNTSFSDFTETDMESRLQFLKNLYPEFEERALFPFEGELSEGVDRRLLERSLLNQPLVWIRIRPQYINATREELKELAIVPVIDYAPGILGTAQSVSLDSLKSYERGYFEIQDLSSQLSSQLFKPEAGQSWWDCCAASGGKSLLLLDLEPSVKLTVSDIRSSSLENLRMRFKRNNYRLSSIFTADLMNPPVTEIANVLFDGVLVDAPCSGSGTWARTPEMISIFDERKLSEFHKMQIGILKTASGHVKMGGALIYMTCSVFKEENESVVNEFLKSGSFKLEESLLLQCAEHLADTLFVARLIRIT